MKSTLKLKIILGFLVITGCTGISNKANVNTTSKPDVATITTSTKPIGNEEIIEKVTFWGNVYNEKGESVDSALVKAKALDEGITWVAEYQLTAGGSFVIRNAPVGAQVEIIVSKNGVLKSKIVTIKPNLYGDPNFNKFDFGHSANDKNSDNSDFLNVDALSKNTDPLPAQEDYSSQVPIIQNIQVRGKIYNEKGEVVNHAFVKLKEFSINNNCSTWEEVLDSEFIFNPTPSNRKIRITVSKNGVEKFKDITLTSDILEKSPHIFDFGHSLEDKNSTNNDFLPVEAFEKNSDSNPVFTAFPENTPTPIILNSDYECIIPAPVASALTRKD